jgi:hypothetical protein
MTIIQLRRGTAVEWTAANPVLANGELGFEIDTTKFKIGTGLKNWSTLEYFIAEPAVQAAIASALQGHISGDPHPQYETSVEVDAKFTAHILNANPHDQYTTDAEVDSRFQNHIADLDPHEQYATDADVETKFQNHIGDMDPHEQYATKEALTSKSDVGHTHPLPPNYSGTWLWNEAISGDPGSGKMLTNTTTFDTTTSISVSKTSSQGPTTGLWWQAIGSGDQIIVVDENRGGVLDALATGPAVDNGTYVTIPVTAGANSTNTNPHTNDLTLAIWLPGGSQGGEYLPLTGGTITGNLAVQGDSIFNYSVHTYGADMGGYKVTGVGDPTAVQDAAPKAYVDAVVTVSTADPSGVPQRDGLLWVKVAP